MAKHWTDDVKIRPIFSSRIDARGSRGNVYEIIGAACCLLREIEMPEDRIEKLKVDTMAAKSYDEVIGLVERWFYVDRDVEP